MFEKCGLARSAQVALLCNEQQVPARIELPSVFTQAHVCLAIVSVKQRADEALAPRYRPIIIIIINGRGKNISRSTLEYRGRTRASSQMCDSCN